MPRAELVAVDLPGHGLSSHRPIDGPTTVLSEGAYYIAEIIDALGWDAQTNADATKTDSSSNDTIFNDDNQVALIGHSMGGGMAVTYAGIFPEQISRVVSLDMFGPEPGTSGQTASDIRSHVLQRRSLGPYGRPHALYKSLDRAIERRQKAATMAPGGHQYLSKGAATELVTRSMKPLYETSSVDDENKAIIKGYRFTHDPRLLWPSLQYLTAEQIQSILEGVECPVCILAAQDGYPFAQDRIDRTIEALDPEIYEILPGSHHLHADPDTADAVVDRVYDFFLPRGKGWQQSRTPKTRPRGRCTVWHAIGDYRVPNFEPFFFLTMFIIETFGRLQFFAKIKWSLFYFCNQRSLLLSKKIMRYRHKITAVKHGSYDIRLQWLVASYHPQPHPNHCFIVHHSLCLIMCCVMGQLLGARGALVSSCSPPPLPTGGQGMGCLGTGGWASFVSRPQIKPGMRGQQADSGSAHPAATWI